MDLSGPLIDFYDRTAQIRAIATAIESSSKQTGALITDRINVDLSIIDALTSNTVNSMALVFLASSFEEFIREEIGQCADYMTSSYSKISEPIRHSIRGSYWNCLVDIVKLQGSVLTKQKPKTPDSIVINKIRTLLESGSGFVVGDDPIHIQRDVFYHHSRNFKPHVVDEIALRLGINNFFDNASDSVKIKSYFGVIKKSESSIKLRSKVNEFYDIRNRIVHSLSSNNGYAVDLILDYTFLFEILAESLKIVLERETSKWQ